MLTAERDIFTCAPAGEAGIALRFCATSSTARPIAHRQKRRIPVPWPGLTRCNPAHCAGERAPRRPVRCIPASKRASARLAGSCARSTPCRVNTSCGSQQAPRLRSSQTSLRIFVICRPCAKETASALKLGRAARNIGRIVAEQLGQHLAHDTGHVVAIVVQVAASAAAPQAGVELEARHAVAHQLDAALDGGALRRAQAGGDAHDAIHVARPDRARSAVCGPTGACSRSRASGAGSSLPPTTAAEALQESQRFGARKRRLVLDGVGDSAQQIGVGHRECARPAAVAEWSAQTCAKHAAESDLDRPHRNCRNPCWQYLGNPQK